jgi:hypothetical protein
MWYIRQSPLFILILSNTTEHYITTGDAVNYTSATASVNNAKKNIIRAITNKTRI